jgi:hypothetical protein
MSTQRDDMDQNPALKLEQEFATYVTQNKLLIDKYRGALERIATEFQHSYPWDEEEYAAAYIEMMMIAQEALK